MNTTRKFPDIVRNPYTWAITISILVSLILSVLLSELLHLNLTQGILNHYERRIETRTYGESKTPAPDIRKLERLSLWGESSGKDRFAAAASRSDRNLTIPAGSSLILKGIVRYPDGTYEAAFSDQQGKRSFIVRKGDKLNNFEVLDIKPDQVIVSREGKRSAYYLFNKAPKKTKKPSSTRHLSSVRGSNRVALKKNEVQAALSDMASFLRQVRIVPYMEKGKPKGFQLLDIVPGSIVARVGLKNGDVVERVNGKPIHTPQEAMQLFTLLQNGQGLTLEIKRNNQRKTITIDLK